MAVLQPPTVYTARVNQTFSTKDKILEVTYDGGIGTLANVKADMMMLIGSSAGAHDKGIVRIRKAPTSTIFYVGENSDAKWADNLYLTVLADFDLWPRHITLSGSTPLMDGEIAYSNQHSLFDPVPVMGSHRILKLEDTDVSSEWDGSASWVYDSSISAYAWVCATASSSSNMNTSTPTINFDDFGWHLVYLTVTAANGKTAAGARYVGVWDDEHPLSPSAEIGTPYIDMSAGGWQFPVTLYTGATLSDIRDRALVILFAEDHYGATAQSIGPLEGCENIIAIGRIAGETIDWNPEQGKVDFTVQGAHHWFGQMKGFPSGLQMVTGTPAAWTEMGSLTVGRALWHFLHWRTTATRVMDVFVTDDARLQTEVSSMGGKLWGQIAEFTFNTILANVGVDRFGRFISQIDPQMIPEADRSSIPTVMTITKKDWQGTPNIERVTVEETGLIDLSGVSVNSSARGTSFFSLSPGHVMKRYGDDEVIDHLSAFDAQAENNQQAGLILGWRDNEFPQIDFELSANNRLFDCYPNQYAETTIEAADTPRGIAYSGKLIPRYVALPQDEGGFCYTEISFEAVTVEQNSTDGDIPFSPADVSAPPIPSFPPLPEFPIILPGFPEGSKDGPKRVLFHDPAKGFIYCKNFYEDSTKTLYATVNAGLTGEQYQNANFMFVTPNGALYVGRLSVVDSSYVSGLPGSLFEAPFIARAPSIGATFTVLYDETTIRPSPHAGKNWGLFAVGYNPLVADKVAFVMGTVTDNKKFWIGSGISFAPTIDFDPTSDKKAGLSYGLNKWLYTREGVWGTLVPDGSAGIDSGSESIAELDIFTPFLSHVRASTTGRTFHLKAGGGGLVVAEDNLDSITTITDADFDGTGFASDPSGNYLMTRYGAGARGKSSDAGATWAALGSLPVGGWVFQYAGGKDVTSRWIAAGAVIRYTPDFGITWQNKESASLNAITFTPAIDMIRVVEY